MTITQARMLIHLSAQEIDACKEYAKLEGKGLGTVLDREARNRGYHRIRMPDGTRKWIHESQTTLMNYSYNTGYRQSCGERKRTARLKVSAKRRKAIAAMGGRARHKDHYTKEAQLWQR